MVTFVSLMVHVYTIGYMADDPGYQRFFAYISLFTFSMMMLVMANNFLQLFFGWEAVGLVSYLLIGFWFTRPTAIYANLKAFLVNRVGDFGFLLGVGFVFATFGTLDYGPVFAEAPRFANVVLDIIPGHEWSLMSAICICLFIGAMGKSAQFPLHVWLPDSMEGPTPISALIHAATMVTAGIFMVARMSPLFELSQTALSFVIVIGAITCFFMALIAIVQYDIKRVVAYSTLSQLGYMTMALGASAYSVAIFHLMTHAFFKAVLFLGAGSVIIALHHEQDMRKMGGLRKYMPITYLTVLIGALANAGIPPFAGFFSKDSIVEALQIVAHAGPHVRLRAGPRRASSWAGSIRSGSCSSPSTASRASIPMGTTKDTKGTKKVMQGQGGEPEEPGHEEMHGAAARVALGGDAAADPARHPVDLHRRDDHRPDALRRLVRRRDREDRDHGGDGERVPRRAGRWSCMRSPRCRSGSRSRAWRPRGSSTSSARTSRASRASSACW